MDELRKSVAVVMPQALRLLNETVASIEGDEWERPSNLTGWSVRELVGHVTGSVNKLSALISDDPVAAQRSEPADWAHEDPVAQLAALSDRAVTLLEQAPFEESRTSPAGAVPLAGALRFPTVDAIVHAWDIRHSLGRELELPEALVAFVEALTADVVERAGGTPPGFDDPVAPSPGDTRTQLVMKSLGRKTD